MFSCEGCPLGELSGPDALSCMPFPGKELAAAAISFFEALPRFFRCRAYSQLSPDSNND